MLLAVALVAGWTGAAFVIAGAKKWPWHQLMVGNWGPESATDVIKGAGGTNVTPGTPNSGGTLGVPGAAPSPDPIGPGDLVPPSAGLSGTNVA